MIPLRLELSEKTALRVQDAPQALKDEIEERHNLLLEQVRQLYSQKQHELEAYIDRRVDEHDAALAREEEASEQALNASRIRIKSIVKRSPSTSEKRVSFSSSPPKVELFKKDYFEDDDDSGDERRPPVVAPNGEAVNFRSHRTVTLYPFPQPSKVAPAPTEPADATSSSDRPAHGRSEPSHKSSETTTSEPALSEGPKAPSPDTTTQPASWSVEDNQSRDGARGSADDKSIMDNEPPVRDQRPERPGGPLHNPDEMFPFEDLLEPPSVTEDDALTVGDHHAPFDLPDASNNAAVADPVPVLVDSPGEKMIVGSAPIAIVSRGDNSLSSRRTAEALDEDSDDIEVGGSPSRLELPNASQTDPSQMSFSQRMEWENILALKSHRAN